MTHHWNKESALYFIDCLIYCIQTGARPEPAARTWQCGLTMRLYFHFYVARINWFLTNWFNSSSHNSWYTTRLGGSQLWISYIGCITSFSFPDCGHTIVPTWIGPQTGEIGRLIYAPDPITLGTNPSWYHGAGSDSESTWRYVWVSDSGMLVKDFCLFYITNFISGKCSENYFKLVFELEIWGNKYGTPFCIWDFSFLRRLIFFERSFWSCAALVLKLLKIDGLTEKWNIINPRFSIAYILHFIWWIVKQKF